MTGIEQEGMPSEEALFSEAVSGVAPETQPEAVTPPQSEEAGERVPEWRLAELREARDAERARATKAEAEVAETRRQWEQSQRQLDASHREVTALRAPRQPVNLFENPDAFVGRIEDRLAAGHDTFQRELRKLRLENNLAISSVIHKDEFQPAYDAFVKAAKDDASVRTRVFSSADPGGSMIAWHREQRALQEIGNDPSAYMQRKLDEALKDPTFLARAVEAANGQGAGNARPNVRTDIPPSLRRMQGAPAASGATDQMSDAELFAAAVPR